MEINLENYEAYLLDLWEDSLSEEEKTMLFNFLTAHPEIDAELPSDSASNIALNEKFTFDSSALLFDEINLKNYEHFFIAYSENDLNKEEKENVDHFVENNPQLVTIFQQFQKAKLIEEDLVFPLKSELKSIASPVFSIQLKTIITSIAACLLFLLWMNLDFKSPEQRYVQQTNSALEAPLFKSSDSSQNNQINNNLVQKKSIAPAIQKVEKNTILEHQNIPHKKEEHIAFSNNSTDQKNEVEIARENKEKKPLQHHFKHITSPDLSEIITGITNSENVIIRRDELAEQSKNSKEALTLKELSESFLKEKDWMNEEEKINLKGIINSIASLFKTAPEPEFMADKDSKSNKKVFKLGDLKIERISTN